MQFNFLGGNTQRDTLQNALGQRNQVLESQLDFSKSAFTTGVQGVGATMRQAMQIGQQDREAVMRDKASIREGMLNRQKEQELLGQRLKAEETEFNRKFGMEGQRLTEQTKQRQAEIDAATTQRGLETSAATAQRKIDADAALEREKLRIKAEADAKAGLMTDAQKAEAEKLTKSNEGTIAGIMSVWDTKDKATVWELDEDTDTPETYDETTGEALTYMKGSSVQRKMREHRDRIMQAANDISDPAARAAYLTRVQNEGLLDFAKTRGLYDARFKAEEDARAASERGSPAAAVTGASR